MKPVTQPLSPFDSQLSCTREPLAPLPAKTKSRINKWTPVPFEEKPSFQEALNSLSLRDPVRTMLAMRD